MPKEGVSGRRIATREMAAQQRLAGIALGLGAAKRVDIGMDRADVEMAEHVVLKGGQRARQEIGAAPADDCYIHGPPLSCLMQAPPEAKGARLSTRCPHTRSDCIRRG